MVWGLGFWGLLPQALVATSLLGKLGPPGRRFYLGPWNPAPKDTCQMLSTATAEHRLGGV